MAMTFCGWIATLAGWYVTEIGRQPFLVYGVLNTADAVTHNRRVMCVFIDCVFGALCGATGRLYQNLVYMARRSVEIEEIQPHERAEQKRFRRPLRQPQGALS